jgi:hypothetical protein
VGRVKNQQDVVNAWGRWQDFCYFTLPARGGQLVNQAQAISQKVSL